ncbi:MAG TPA: RidA family protein [Rhodocyclaceae bacterium]|nr:RidA family protein [Rhodocyclaceae bacterium]
MNIERYGITQRYSDLVVHNHTIYLVEVPKTEGANVTVQTRELLHSVEHQLRGAGSGKHRLLMVQIFLRDMADYSAMNDVWEEWLPNGSAPVRACVQAQLANPEYRVEMVFTAAAGND